MHVTTLDLEKDPNLLHIYEILGKMDVLEQRLAIEFRTDILPSQNNGCLFQH